MKATEMFVEQLLIGFVIMFISVVMISGSYDSFAGHWSGDSRSALFIQVVFGTFAFAAAYLTGVLYDRCADTLLEDIEQYNILKFVLSGLSGAEIGELQSKKTLKKDPFPFQDIRMSIMAQGGELTEYASYLRSRIRLSRSLTTLMPALFIALTVQQAKPPEYARTVLALCVAAVYALALLSKVSGGKQSRDKPPKTGDLSLSEGFGKDHVTIAKDPHTKGLRVTMTWMRRGLYIGDDVVWGLVTVTLMGLIVAAAAVKAGPQWVFLYPLGGAALTFLSGWVWLRIYDTYLKYMKRYQEMCDRKAFMTPCGKTAE